MWQSLCVALLAVTSPLALAFELTSPTLTDGGTLPAEHVFHGMGCTGENRSPALAWKGAPAGTRSYAVTVFDPDAPTDSGWWHWLVVNLPASVQALPAQAGAAGHAWPVGAQPLRNDFGHTGYGGACPPPGAPPHRYRFTVYALDVERLDLPEGASAALASYLMRRHALASARIEVRYGR